MKDQIKILDKIDWNVLNTYIQNKLIKANKHPDYDVWILNYTPETQFSQAWDIYTSSCRGMIIDIEGNILARPFKKFKNYEEYDPTEIDMSQEFEIFEKMDGSLIILFFMNYTNNWIVASRGSFTSEQAIEANKILKTRNAFDSLDKNSTYLFEVLFPENRIVINYGDIRDLVLLARVNTKTGKELYYNDLLLHYSPHFTVVKKYDIKNINDLSELKKLEEDNKEGFVVRFVNGMRIKIKFTEYLRLHKILTNISNVKVWEYLKDNGDFKELITNVPDEFYAWVNKTIVSLQQEFNNIERLALKEFIEIYYVNNFTTRKDFAIEVLKKTKYSSILFKIYDKKPYDELIYKQIKPVCSKPFKDGYEDNL